VHGDADDLLSVDEGPVEGAPAAVLGEEPGVEVEGAGGGEEVAGEDRAVARGDEEGGRGLREAGDLAGLEGYDRDPLVLGEGQN
jgi:hypothetical protein